MSGAGSPGRGGCFHRAKLVGRFRSPSVLAKLHSIVLGLVAPCRCERAPSRTGPCLEAGATGLARGHPGLSRIRIVF